MHHLAKVYCFAAKLAIFSIAMLFIAPIISKSLHTPMHSASAMTSMQGVSPLPGDECAMMSPSPSSKAPSFDRKMLDDMACGYCQLLAHFPFLQWVILLALVIVYSPLRSRGHLPLITRPLTGYWSSSQARAPPSF
ncbi:DUF2946 domain-containing protein [Rosenbergiella nectarea]|uniref:DUF2946 domain-containing protein n=1 Tax=Rosenbergiella nectarea TaxID=988801 RepID=UPI001BDB1BA2|nr:DUF2946 domain-containing protein [Rosenbergiella nectarea]MBT0731158.1 DUF2946 domain-containing protein [Rosenbergiella nectarea subsp. apis]